MFIGILLGGAIYQPENWGREKGEVGRVKVRCSKTDSRTAFYILSAPLSSCGDLIDYGLD
jgi:hypothetical protein